MFTKHLVKEEIRVSWEMKSPVLAVSHRLKRRERDSGRKKSNGKHVSICDRETSCSQGNARSFPHGQLDKNIQHNRKKVGIKLQPVINSIFCWSRAKMAGILIKTLLYPILGLTRFF